MYIPAKINTNLSPFLQKCVHIAVVYFLFISLAAAQLPPAILSNSQKQLQDSLIKSGYWEAKVFIDEHHKLIVEKGRPYFWSEVLIIDNAKVMELAAINKLKNQTANQYLLEEILEKFIYKKYHRNGYPFAKANIAIEDLADNQVTAKISIQKKNFIIYDSLTLLQSSKGINAQYLSRALQVETGKPFDMKAFQTIPDKLNQFGFLSSLNTPSLYFANNKARIQLNLDSKSNNQLDAFIGIMPTETGTNFTGQVDVRLRNLFRRAVNFDVNWQKYSASSQFLEVQLQQAYAFRSLVGVDLAFELLQEDSTFLQTKLHAGIMYPVASSFTLGLSYQQLATNVLREFPDSETETQDPMRSSKIDAAEISVHWKKPLSYPQLHDYSNASVSLGIGNKQIVNFSSLPQEWQNVEEQSINLTARIKWHYQKVLGKRFLMEAIAHYAAIQNDAVAKNDLLRIGGLQNLRGFDRNYFYTESYGLLNLNYRYFFDQRSSFFLLTDFAHLKSEAGFAYAFGAGTDIKSKNGWFRIIYALGANQGNPPNFSLGKIHFGYIAIF